MLKTSKFDVSFGFTGTARTSDWYGDHVVKSEMNRWFEDLFDKVKDLPGDLAIRLSMEVSDSE